MLNRRQRQMCIRDSNHLVGYTLTAQSLMAGQDDGEEQLIEQFISQLDEVEHVHTIHHIHQHLDPGDTTGESFEFVLDLILDGLARQKRADSRAARWRIGHNDSSRRRGRTMEVRPTFRVLGPLQIERGSDIASIGGLRERAILAGLLLTPGQAVTTDQLADLAWPGTRPRDVPHALRTHVMRLRRHLGPEAIMTTPGAYALAADPEDVDAHRFSSLAESANEELWADQPSRAEATLATALDIWQRGDPWLDLAGTTVGDAARARLIEQRLEVEERLAALRLRRQRARVDVVEKLAMEAPFREHRWLLLMHALFVAGQQPRALRSSATVRSRLQDEAGLEPEPPLRAMEHRILEQDPTLLDLDPLELVLG